MNNGVFYLTRRSALALSDFTALSPDAEVTIRSTAEDKFVHVAWAAGQELHLELMGQDDLGSHLHDLAELMAATGHPLLPSLIQQAFWFTHAGPDDVLTTLLAGLCERLEGFWSDRRGVWDGQGRCLFSLVGAQEPASDRPEMPSAERVARRFLALSAAAYRARLEQWESRTDALRGKAALLKFLLANDLVEELEEAEHLLVAADIGEADKQQTIDSSWRVEGATVLAWALGWIPEIPLHDEASDLLIIAPDHPYPGDSESPALKEPKLARRLEELYWAQRRMLAIHWRTRQMMVETTPVDWISFAEDNWFGGFDPVGLPSLEGDLAISGAPAFRADPDRLAEARSIAMERHQAMNWLIGHDPIYSLVDVST